MSVTLLLIPHPARAQTCGFPAGGTLTGIVNTYYPGNNTAAAGATSVGVVDGSRFPAGNPQIAAGDMLLVMQMQDAQINSSNSGAYGDGVAGDPATGSTATNSTGLFEYVVATSAVAGGNVSIVGAGAGNGLINTYTNAAATATRGQRRFQVVRVPRYGSATLSSGLTAGAWNGRAGGILAIDVSGTLTLGGAVSVDGLGFRGGTGLALAGQGGLSNLDYLTSSTLNANGMKGEGIAGTPDLGRVNGADGYPNGDMARGAPGNAGGGGTDGNPGANDRNTGGGGGANGGVGGTGGSGWPGANGCPPAQGSQTGGFGGSAFTAGATSVILGGGGGAGTRNNAGLSNGGNGGGIVLIRAGLVSGAGTITARGLRPLSTANDGGGGGGAGGTIVVLAATGNLLGLTVDASGGQGGYANLPSPPAPDAPPTAPGGVHHGPGGGGGGGVILLSSAPAASSVAGGAPGLTNTCTGDVLTQTYDATAGAAGVVQANVALGQLPGVQSCTVATRATLRGLRVNPAGTVEFATGSQRGTLAFNVYATHDPSGAGKRTRLNGRPLLAPVPSSVQPILYRVETPPILAPYLLIEEIEVGGHRRSLGPFPVPDVPLERAFERLEARLKGEESQQRRGALMLSGRSLVRPGRREGSDLRILSPPPFDPPGVKIEVAQAGPVRVALADLVAQGLPGSIPAPSNALRVTNLGRPVPFRVIVDDQGAKWIAFDAEALATDYTARNVYVVSWGRPAPVPAVPFTRSGFGVPPGMLRVEQNLLYAPFVAQGADPWIWDLLVAGQPAGPYSFDLPSFSASADRIPVRIGVVGGSDHVHRVSASLNGHDIGELVFSGKLPALLKGTLPVGAIRPAGNQLEITYTAQVTDRDDVGLLFLDTLDLGVSVPLPTTWVPVDRLAPYDPALPQRRGNYMIVTHALFEDHARRIADLKRAEGYQPWVVDAERAYDRYSSGVFEATAIQALIREAVREGVRSVLLVGGDTYDPRDFSGVGNMSYVPSLNGWDGQFGRVPSENQYADIDGDGLPDVAIGRLPVRTLGEADTLVDKVARQAQVLHDAGATHVVAVDNQGGGDISFLGEAQRAVGLFPSGSQVSWADLAQGVPQARAALRSGLEAGPLATHYFGHGGFDIWADEGLLTLDDVAALPANGRETVLFTWTCETQWYQLQPGINESLLLLPRGGALAAVGPAGITDPALQVSLYTSVYRYFLAGKPLGEAIRQAKVDALRAGATTRPVIEGWNLLGDPALRLDSRGVQR